MPIDPQIPLMVQTPAPQDPLQSYGRIAALKGALQQQQVQEAQLEGLNQENAMRGIQMQQMKQLNTLYQNALAPDGTIDSGALSTAMAKNGLGSQIPTVLKGVTEYQKQIADLAKTRLETGNLQADAMGSLGNTLKTANGDPQLFLTKVQAAINAKAIDAQTVTPQIQQVQQSLLQDPTGAQARKLVLNFSEQMVEGSEKWKALQTAQLNATGNQQRGAAAMQNADTNRQKYLQGERARILGTSRDQPSWDAGIETLKKMGDSLDGVPTKFSPPAAAAMSNAGKTPHEVATETQAQQNFAATQSYRDQTLNQGQQRINISQQNADTSEDRLGFQRTKQTGAGANGTQGRFDTKEVDAARIQLDKIHQQRTAFGAALTTPNGENYLDPKTGKMSPNEMDDRTRQDLQQQYNNVTAAGQRIIERFKDDKSGGRIRSNELPAAGPIGVTMTVGPDQTGQTGETGQPRVPAAGSSPSPVKPPPAKGKPNVAPEGTIVQNPKTGQRLQKINGQWKPLP